MFLIFTIIERFNSGMTLIDNDMAKVLLFIFSVVAIVVSGMLIHKQRREDQ
jgi:cell division protein FtsL